MFSEQVGGSLQLRLSYLHNNATSEAEWPYLLRKFCQVQASKEFKIMEVRPSIVLPWLFHGARKMTLTI